MRRPYNVAEMEAYIREAAKARGIDPDVAVKVAKAEGLGRGVWQSNAKKGGVREPSYGPFQMLVGGPGTGFKPGLGNAFQKDTGLDPSKPENAYATVDYALDRAVQDGWGAWYGARKVGVTGKEGIAPDARPIGVTGKPPVSPLSNDLSRFAKNTEADANFANIQAGQAGLPKGDGVFDTYMAMNAMNADVPPAPPGAKPGVEQDGQTAIAQAMGQGLRSRAGQVADQNSQPLAMMPSLDQAFDYPLGGQPQRVVDGRAYGPENYDIGRMNPEAAYAARRAFDNLGIDPQINSAFRAGGYNEAVGGASRSQHKHGNALDISTRGMSDTEKAALVDSLMAEGMGGIGVGQNIIHADTGVPRSWTYGNSVPDEVRSVMTARYAGDRLNRFPSDFGVIGTPPSKPNMVPDLPGVPVAAVERGSDLGQLPRQAGVEALVSGQQLPNPTQQANVAVGINSLSSLPRVGSMTEMSSVPVGNFGLGGAGDRASQAREQFGIPTFGDVIGSIGETAGFFPPREREDLELFNPIGPEPTPELSYGPSQRLGPRAAPDLPELSYGPTQRLGPRGIGAPNALPQVPGVQFMDDLPQGMPTAPMQAPVQAPVAPPAPQLPPLAPPQFISPRQVSQPQPPSLDLVPNAAPSVASTVAGHGLMGDAGPGYSYGYSPWGSGVARIHDSAPEQVKIAASGPGLFGAVKKDFGVDLTPGPGKMGAPLASAAALGLAALGAGPFAAIPIAANMMGGSSFGVNRMDVVPQQSGGGLLGNLFGGLFGGNRPQPPQQRSYGGNEVSFSGPIGRNSQRSENLSEASRAEVERATRSLY